ncbi:putative programmed cell death 6-interacting protein [Trypoxylus dichotomus]
MEVQNNSSPYCKLCCVNITSYTIGKSCGSHTLCKYPANTIGPSCRGYVNVKFTAEEKAFILDIHNSLRNKVALGSEERGNPGPQSSAANMRLLMWNDELANIAERWSAQCIYGHDKCRDTALFPVGQNLARGNLATNSESSLVIDWYDEVIFFSKQEISNFLMPRNAAHPAAHYSQLVWADTNQIGCARAIFQQSKGANISYKEHLICNYGPSGNIPNQPVYKSGKPCTSCPDGTSCSIDYEGLCEIERKFGRVERLSMKKLISIPLKKPYEVDIVKPLKNIIQSRYSTADKPEDYGDAINELAKLRTNGIWKAFEKYESSLDVVYSYYDQLVSLEQKIPPQEIQIPFKWRDAFDKGSIFGSKSSLTIASLSYEKICILFNIAALQSAVASSQSTENDEALKLAAKLLQAAAGIYNHLKSTVMLQIQQDPTEDLNPDTLGALSSLMLAQAQEMFVQKAIHDNMKDSIVAKLAQQCEELYADCLKIFQRDTLKALWDKDWIPLIAGKQAAMRATALYYQSLVCKNDKAVGKEIAYLEHCIELFKASAQRSGRNLYSDISIKAQRNLAEAKKDNDFIYHERVPDIKTLDPIGKAQPAKLLPVTHPMSRNYRDLFSELVPVVVHQAMAAYDLRKSEITQTEIGRLRESTQVLNSVLASLNLPAAIEVTDGDGLPPSMLEKAEKVKELGGISELEKLINDLPELLKRNKDILDESDRMLNEEKQADESLRQQFKEKWTRTPSDKLTEMFRSNSAKYREIITNAEKADKIVRDKLAANREGIVLLSGSNSDLQGSVPSGNGGTVSNSSAVNTLRQLMDEVDTIKAERDAIEQELTSATLDMKSKFLSALANDGSINEPALSVESLGQVFGPLQKQVKESIEKQEGLLERIQITNNEFVQERGATTGGREQMMCRLANAYDAFRDINNNVKEGTKFYNDLTQILVSAQNKISDYCFARKTEKEELLKDLTQASSRQAPAVPPAQPGYHSSVTPGTTPSPAAPVAAPTPTQPQAGSVQTSLPYPVYVQGMPIPYGASSQAPYPSYTAPPPMPQGYNPYGTMPYPNSYNYPGGFPQAPGYPQQQGYPQQPQGYQQQPQGYQGQGYQQQQPPPNSGCIVQLRIVNNFFKEICSKILNDTFVRVKQDLDDKICIVFNEVKRRESENDIAGELKNNTDDDLDQIWCIQLKYKVLQILKSEISVLHAVCERYVKLKVYCFTGGKILDYFYQIMNNNFSLNDAKNPLESYATMQLFLLNEEFMDHFEEVVEPEILKKKFSPWFGVKMADILDLYANSNYHIFADYEDNHLQISARYEILNPETVIEVDIPESTENARKLIRLSRYIRNQVRWQNFFYYVDAPYESVKSIVGKKDRRYNKFCLNPAEMMEDGTTVYNRDGIAIDRFKKTFSRRLGNPCSKENVCFGIELQCSKNCLPARLEPYVASITQNASTSIGENSKTSSGSEDRHNFVALTDEASELYDFILTVKVVLPSEDSSFARETYLEVYQNNDMLKISQTRKDIPI